jgi:hypothetical protein
MTVTHLELLVEELSIEVFLFVGREDAKPVRCKDAKKTRDSFVFATSRSHR